MNKTYLTLHYNHEGKLFWMFYGISKNVIEVTILIQNSYDNVHT